MNFYPTRFNHALSAAALTIGGVLGALVAPAARAEGLGLDATLAATPAATRGVKKVSLTLGATRDDPLWQGDIWRLKLRHEVEVGFWHVPRARDIVEAGYSPVLRLERSLSGGQSPSLYFEASIGPRLLSHTRIAPDYRISTAFQFSDMVGLGVQWGRSTLGLRFQHLSNADIKRPNPGINFLQARYTYLF
jgi:hypothetical protein